MQKWSGQLPVLSYPEQSCEKHVLPAATYCFSVSAHEAEEKTNTVVILPEPKLQLNMTCSVT